MQSFSRSAPAPSPHPVLPGLLTLLCLASRVPGHMRFCRRWGSDKIINIHPETIYHPQSPTPGSPPPGAWAKSSCPSSSGRLLKALNLGCEQGRSEVPPSGQPLSVPSCLLCLLCGPEEDHLSFTSHKAYRKHPARRLAMIFFHICAPVSIESILNLLYQKARK